MKLHTSDFIFIGICIECFLYGLYSGIFALYLQYHSSKKKADNTILFYALCALYIVAGIMVSVDTAAAVIHDTRITIHIPIVQSILFGCSDFVSQSILIYRCWIVWGCNIQVVIIPSILAISFLATWIGGVSVMPAFIDQGRFVVLGRRNMLIIASLVLSMTVNTLVMGLIVFRIFQVFREVRSATSSDDEKTFGIIGGRKLWSIMFVIIESGMILFAIQLARVVVSASIQSTGDFNAFDIIVGIHEMLNGITPTIILVRVSIGLSFYDEASMIEAAGNILSFAPRDDLNSISETGGISHEGSLFTVMSDPIPETRSSQERPSLDIPHPRPR